MSAAPKAQVPERDPERLALSLPGRLIRLARSRPDAVALREKVLGVWNEISWHQYLAEVEAVGHLLDHLGIGPGDHIAVLSENRTEWVYTDLGAQGIGARTVGIYQTDAADSVAYILSHSEAKVLFCEDQEQVDKAVEVADRTPSVRHVVVFDPRGTRSYRDPRLSSFKELIEIGRRRAKERPTWFTDRVLALDPDAPAMVVYTSGTTGRPKGALLTHRNVVTPADESMKLLGAGDDEQLLSYLPLCHVAEKIFTLFLPLTSGAVVHFGESIATVTADLREVSPTIFLGVPRIWEKMHATITIKMKDSSWLKRTLFDVFVRLGRGVALRRIAGTLRLWDRVVWALGDLLVYRPLQERLGMRRCRVPASGAAPISPDLLLFYHSIGIRIVEGYGQTECAGISHINEPDALRLGTVGRTLPGTEFRLDTDGEILVRGPTVFAGYLHDPETTSKTVDEEGWLHTGDIGEVDESGYVRITGRKKEIIVTSGGKNLSPERIENALKMSPYVKEAVAIGDGKKFVSALVQIELDAVGDWATRRGLPYTSFEDLASKPEVVLLVSEEIDKANALLARVESVRAFRLLPKQLNQDDGEVTATQKVRRRVVHERFASLIDEMYQR